MIDFSKWKTEYIEIMFKMEDGDIRTVKIPKKMVEEYSSHGYVKDWDVIAKSMLDYAGRKLGKRPVDFWT